MTITVSYPSSASSTVPQELERDSYRAYLRRSKRGDVSEGEEWSEFVNCGCGDVEDVVLRVEDVDDGTIDDETEFEFVART
ncbi:MAG: hypothetical protein ABEI52_09785 [Halobacteriaceae archaeon]